jgi:lycopene beta-cyclase
VNYNSKYDYIIGGAGLAGLTLAWKMLDSGLLLSKTLLIIEADTKTKNDRTWCFWSKNEPWLTEIPISNTWNAAGIYGDHVNLVQHLKPYKYYKVEGIEYYQFILKKIKGVKNIHWLQDSIVSENVSLQEISTLTTTYHFKEYLFKGYFLNRQLPDLNTKNKHFIWQHFLGWKIKTQEPLFNPEQITYMDMRVPAVPNGLAFAYVLPETKSEALVEYTLFSAELWKKSAYENALRDYISQYLKPTDFEIIEEEFNKIPMTNARFAQREGNIIPIGTLAGTVKPSTGYSFLRNFKHILKIVENLNQGNGDFAFPAARKHQFYDEVLINVLHTGKSPGHKVFTELYNNNRLTLLFKFLDEETTLWEDFKIMNSVPKLPFIKAVKEEFFS